MHFHKNLYKELLYCKDFSTDEISKLNGRKCVKTIKIILTLLDCPSTNKKSQLKSTKSCSNQISQKLSQTHLDVF